MQAALTLMGLDEASDRLARDSLGLCEAVLLERLSPVDRYLGSEGFTAG